MSLREDAESDLELILEDGATGFGWEIMITDPFGDQATLTGFSNDISQVIDPETGVVVSGRAASIALRVSSLTQAGLSLPVGIADTLQKPWIVSFTDINENLYTFKVVQSNPDRALGIVTCLLEAYEVNLG